MFQPGQRIREYEIEVPIGEGAMGQVWRARHIFLNQVVALKVLDPASGTNPDRVRRFVAEGMEMAAFQHPRILNAKDFFQEGLLYVLVLPFMGGGTLADIIQEHPNGMPLAEVQRILMPMLRALDHAHRNGVVHRDVKPANILFDDQGEPFLSDFGIAKRLGVDQGTRTKMAIGTPAYMAPEQGLTPQDIDGRADQYALACVAYEMVTGQLLFGEHITSDLKLQIAHVNQPPLSPRSLRRDLPEAWEAVCLKALAKAREDRWESCGAMADALDGGGHEVAHSVRRAPTVLEVPPVPMPARGQQVPTERSGISSVQVSVVARPEPSNRSRKPWWKGPVGISMAVLILLGGGLGLWKISQNTNNMNAILDSTTSPNELGMEMVKIPAGTFLMGSADGENGREVREGPQHQVTMSRTFWVGKYPVTQKQWQELMGNNPGRFQKVGPDAPVENVSWDDAQAFIQKLNERQREWTYRLPTEAEWEYACRAGTPGPRYGDLDAIAWYDKNSGGTTHPVGQKKPNAFGLCDMNGNVWQWCQDYYGDYGIAPVTDPQGPSSGQGRVVRGGSWLSDAAGIRSASRGFDSPEYRGNWLGFRVCATVRTQAATVARIAEGKTADITAPTKDTMPPPPKESGIDMVKIPAGTFLMGSPKDEKDRYDDELQHQVTISRSFWIGKYPVTQKQWQDLMGNNPSAFKKAGPDAPVEMVSWNDAQKFIQKLNERQREWTYRLLTEAEWEYACRAGSTGQRYGDLDTIAWYLGNSGKTSHPVGQKQPNAFGLYDLQGNVWQWCQDWYGNVSAGSQTDPTGTSSGESRVVRGGSWYETARTVRSACRGDNTPGNRSRYCGFRVCAVARTT